MKFLQRALPIFAGLSMTAIVHGFEEKPWLGNLWEFYLDAGYAFSRYSSVANANPPLKHPSNDNLIGFDFGLSPAEEWDVAMEVEFVQTPRQRWGRRSTAIQVRKLWLDDTIGDALSLTTGATVRLTSYNSLRDISCPYSARWDVEFHSAVGKEWNRASAWTTRFYGVGAVGQGSWGAPWTSVKLAFDVNKVDVHQIEFYALGYWGFGRRHTVDISHFKGWGSYDHSSVDLGLGYFYYLGAWGHLRLDYFHRVYARVYPRGVNSLMLSYHLPFSLF